ncbi:MAG: thioredoxin family protein [Phycisphaerae bacterium]|nr:thioredoxin family protein [Phycisphaerae bacterium]
MLTPAAFRDAFAAGLAWPDYLATATSAQRPRWDAAWQHAVLTPAQAALARSLPRRINVLVISGTWCGDCVQQCPILARIAEAHPAPNAPPAPAASPTGRSPGDAPGICLRFIDRDAHAAFSDHFMICGGRRVPTAIFLNEDFDFVHLLGDRTLARYRAVAAASLGPACPLPGAPVPADERAAVTDDWLREFERVALLLRLSPKLRDRHGD